MSAVEELRALLGVVKQAPADKADEEFYNLMVKAKESLGEMGFHMAQFYYEYANFILTRIEKNMDIFNAAAVPNAEQQEDPLEGIPEDYEDSESEPQQQQPPQAEEGGEAGQEGEAAEEKAEAAEGASAEEAAAKGEPQQQQQGQQGEQEMDDKQICYCNLQFAIRILEGQLQLIRLGKSTHSINDALDGLRRARTRLGDLYMLDEEYQKCMEAYRCVIAQEEPREGFETSRLIAELYYLIGNSLMYENAPGCEKRAIEEYIKAVNILVNNLSIKQGYDISSFELPTASAHKVDRFAYLPKPDDSEVTKEIKDVIACLLDRIEDTFEQIGVRDSYEAEKKKIEEEKRKSEFKPVPENTKVVNLGSFGNRKKKDDAPKE